jgi:molecular chaperone HtpG
MGASRTKLDELLATFEDSGAIGTFVKGVERILTDNKLPFFPDYTDHGIVHVRKVIDSQLQLLHAQAIEAEFNPVTAAALIAAAYLHDLAMHIREDGFHALVTGLCPHAPVKTWPSEGGATAWPLLWSEYKRSLKWLNDRDVRRLVGAGASFREPPDDPVDWLPSDRRVIGEFLRRHHARLAHEIALYGFPGLDSKEFPVLSETLGSSLADLIGAIARSHGDSLRLSAGYVASEHGQAAQPHGVLATLLMALLRISDYLQIESSRAPVALLHLRNPPSKQSQDEWRKHGAVEYVQMDDEKDPEAIYVHCHHRQTLDVFVQMQALLAGIQDEMDRSRAVVSEIYGRIRAPYRTFLDITKSRIRSNLADPNLLERLPFEPIPARFSADGGSLLSLLVRPLYNGHPAYAVRELLQNATDAVRELDDYIVNHSFASSTIQCSQMKQEYPIEIIVDVNDGRGRLVISDKGIGMTPEVIVNFFLRAGASYRRSDEWKLLHEDGTGSPRVIRTGKFGVGVLAGFLLGDKINVTTRHAAAVTGISFEASLDSDAITLLRELNAPVGTRIEILMNERAVKFFNSPGSDRWDWYALTSPLVRRIRNGVDLSQRYFVPLEHEYNATPWRSFSVDRDFKVDWRYNVVEATDRRGREALVCNGIKITNEFGESPQITRFLPKPLRAPTLSIYDKCGKLPLNLQRTDLQYLPEPLFERLLFELGSEVLSEALAERPIREVYMRSWDQFHFHHTALEHPSVLHWITSQNGSVFLDERLLPLVGINQIYFVGGPLVVPESLLWEKGATNAHPCRIPDASIITSEYTQMDLTDVAEMILFAHPQVIGVDEAPSRTRNESFMHAYPAATAIIIHSDFAEELLPDWLERDNSIQVESLPRSFLLVRRGTPFELSYPSETLYAHLNLEQDVIWGEWQFDPDPSADPSWLALTWMAVLGDEPMLPN